MDLKVDPQCVHLLYVCEPLLMGTKWSHISDVKRLRFVKLLCVCDVVAAVVRPWVMFAAGVSPSSLSTIVTSPRAMCGEGHLGSGGVGGVGVVIVGGAVGQEISVCSG